jgi:hypothetical protein
VSSLASVLLCPSCFGQAEGPMIDAARLGTWMLIGVLVAVQLCFVAFFLHLRRQARKAGDPDQESEWSRYQRRRAGRMLEAP